MFDINTDIRRFGFNQNPIRRTWPKLLIVDGIQFDANSFLYVPSLSPLSPLLLSLPISFSPSRPNNLCNSGPSGQWAWCSEDYDTLERSPLNYGPFRQIFEQHFVIVYGTGVCARTHARTHAPPFRACVVAHAFIVTRPTPRMRRRAHLAFIVASAHTLKHAHARELLLIVVSFFHFIIFFLLLFFSFV